MKKVFSYLLLGAITVGSSIPMHAQDSKHSKDLVSISSKSGSIAKSLKRYDIKQKDALSSLNAWLGLSDDYSFKQISEKQDKLGFTQVKYQQLFKNVPLKDGTIVLHFKNAYANSINGRITRVNEKFSIVPSLSISEALQLAKSELSVIETINNYTPELVILNHNDSEGNLLGWKVRIDGKNAKQTLVMANVYVDANTGKVIQTVSLIAHGDVQATAKTLYSGVQTITTDSFADGYRLRDNARKIETYDVGGADENQNTNSNIYFDTAYDITNATTLWDTIPTLMAMNLQVAKPSLLTGLGTSSFLLSYVADSAVTSLDDGNPLTFNIFFAQLTAANLPIASNGLYLPLPKDNYNAGFWKLGFSGVVSDSASFKITDKSIGTHIWNDSLGNEGTYTMSYEKNPALDAHWGMGKTHDYYLDKLNRDSYDNNGSIVRNYINGMLLVGFSQGNAAALPAPYNSMVYGLGDGVTTGPMVGLDVMGHEFSHLVTSSTADLEYAGESGALNESFSDIMGTCIEFYSKDSAANWLIGEDVIIAAPGYLRSMSNPKAPAGVPNSATQPQPDTYKKQYWVNTSNPSQSNDQGGVHTNSGIGNKWFYLLSEGGTGTNDNSYNYNVTGVGIEKAEQIAYRTLTSYLTPTSQYIDAYFASLQAADDLYGDTSVAYSSVKNAWIAVGVIDSTTLNITTTNPLKDKISIYPNPTSGQFSISNNSNLVLNANIVSILGVQVKQIELTRGVNTVDISALSKGIYFINMETPTGVISEKISLK